MLNDRPAVREIVRGTEGRLRLPNIGAECIQGIAWEREVQRGSYMEKSRRQKTAKRPYEAPKAELVVMKVEEKLLACAKYALRQPRCAVGHRLQS